MAANPRRELETLGLSVRLDYIQRNTLENGEFAAMIEKDGLAGMTSNPAIFEQAINEHANYDEAITKLVRSGISVSDTVGGIVGRKYSTP